MFYFFHGYNSTSNSKALALEAALGTKVIGPRYSNADEYFAAIEDAVTAINASRDSGIPQMVAGTSLGAFAAYVISRRTGIFAAFVNPCFRPWDTMNQRAEADWSTRVRKLYESLSCFENHGRFRAFINDDDELFGATFDTDLHAFGVRYIVQFTHGGHRASNFESEIVPLIVRDWQEQRLKTKNIWTEEEKKESETGEAVKTLVPTLEDRLNMPIPTMERFLEQARQAGITPRPPEPLFPGVSYENSTERTLKDRVGAPKTLGAMNTTSI